MWLHVLIFLLLAMSFVFRKAGWLPGGRERWNETQWKEGYRLFLAVAAAGNLLGMLVTYTNAQKFNNVDYKLKKEENETYEEKYIVQMEEKEAVVYVRVPQQEGEKSQVEEAEEKTSEEEQFEKQLQNILEEYNEQKQDPAYYYLPETWNGQELKWKKPKDNAGSLLASLCLIAALSVMLAKVQEVSNKEKKRQEQLFMDYPGMIMKFTLLVQAGMTARKAFQKMAMDYRRYRDTDARFAYEEIYITCCEMDGGVSEGESYRRFGERCGHVKYKTFSTLLVQNLQKGSRFLADVLEKESIEAWDERKRKARVLGEAAATKLLVPMVMMMGVVMAIIMIPAILSFYSGI
ncbi:MAG: type II secretion system F family protein [Blautia sp.]|nr:type II secretion system F family protein [Blautia sp.]